MDFAVGAADPFGKGNPFSGGVHDELLETIDDLDAKEHAAVFGGFDRFAHALDSPVGEDLFVFAGQQLARPGTVIDAGHDGAVHMFHRSRHILEKSDAFFARGGVLRGQVHIGGHADAVSEAEARVRGGAFERVSLRIAHAGDFRRVDLKNIEATFLGSFDKLDGLRVPVLGPVSEVYSDGVHKLMQIGAGLDAVGSVELNSSMLDAATLSFCFTSASCCAATPCTQDEYCAMSMFLQFR